MRIIYLCCLLALIAACAAPKISPQTQPTARIEFEAPEAYPEGIVYDSIADVFYVSSAHLGTVGKVNRQGNYSVLYNDNSLKSTYGLKIHPDGKRLFVCVGDANYSKFSTPDTKKKMIRLISLELPSGKKLTDVDISKVQPGEHFGNDLAFDNQGNVYMTDSYSNVIYKITADGKATVFAKDKQFDTKGVGLNGIVYHPDGFLLVDNSHTGRIYKVNVNNPQQIQKVDIEQYFMGADGMLLTDKNTLTVVVNGGTDKIFQLHTTDNWQTAQLAATTLAVDRFIYPSTATRRGQDIWVMDAKFNELADSNSVLSKKFAIQQAVLKPVPSSK